MKRSRGKLTKLVAMLLSVLLMVGMLGTTAFADIATDTEGKILPGTITVTGAEAELSVTAYRLMDVSYDTNAQQPKEPVYTWVTGVYEWVKANYSDYVVNTGTALEPVYTNEVSEAFGPSDADRAVFYDALAAAIEGGTITGLTAVTATTGAAGTATAGTATLHADMGNYLILLENGMRVYEPSAVNVVPVYNNGTWVMTNPTVELKSTEVTIDKAVSKTEITTYKRASNEEETFAIGDPVFFSVVTDVPTYPENAIAKKYEISDDMTAGLVLDTTSIVVKGVLGETETTLTPGTDYTLTTTGAKRYDDTPVDFHLNFVYANIASYKKIAVYYSATLTKDAVVATAVENKAYLDYTNDPYESGSYRTRDDKTQVYTFGIKVTKLDENQKALSGAQFELKKEGSDTPIKFIKDSDGVYHKANDADAAGAATLSVGEAEAVKGKLTLNGLDEGVYILTETKAPADYIKLKNPVKVTITAVKDDNNKLTGHVTVQNDNDPGYVPVTVTNKKGFDLPKTGGMGTALFTGLGIAIVGVALAMFAMMFRRKRSC